MVQRGTIYTHLKCTLGHRNTQEEVHPEAWQTDTLDAHSNTLLSWTHRTWYKANKHTHWYLMRSCGVHRAWGCAVLLSYSHFNKVAKMEPAEKEGRVLVPSVVLQAPTAWPSSLAFIQLSPGLDIGVYLCALQEMPVFALCSKVVPLIPIKRSGRNWNTDNIRFASLLCCCLNMGIVVFFLRVAALFHTLWVATAGEIVFLHFYN